MVLATQFFLLKVDHMFERSETRESANSFVPDVSSLPTSLLYMNCEGHLKVNVQDHISLNILSQEHVLEYVPI